VTGTPSEIICNSLDLNPANLNLKVVANCFDEKI